MILEKAVPDWRSQVQTATSFADLAGVIKTFFSLEQSKIPGQDPPKDPTDYKNDKSDFGLKVKGIKAREKLNEQAREIIDRVKDPAELTGKDREILMQYSGRGGLTENSQFEYYTPTHVAEGLWDGLAANGFQNGNVLDPCAGAGVFSATKPKGVLVTGADIDPVGSKVAQLLNPEDSIRNQAFEKTVMDTPDDTFDAVVGNVPFGSARGASAHIDAAYKSEKRIERYFILRALDKVRPGGLCCLVVPINIVGAKGGQWEKFRIACSKKAEFLGAHKLPSKTFGTQGTDTVVDVVVFKKHPKDFLERLETIPFDTLKSANVVWDEFISGKYWLGEGKKFIMGKYMPKVEGDRWSRETVDGDVDNAGLKAKLAQRFDSRIDWEALDIAEPIVRNYIDGDRKMINGAEYEMQNGMWVRVITENTSMAVDAQKYGAATIDELKGKLSSPKQTLGMSADQVFAAYKAFPELLSPLQKASIEFAMSQPKVEYQEQLFRGSVIGGMIARYQNSMNDGTAEDDDRLELQELVTKEIDRYGHPKNNKGLLLTGESSKMFGLFKNAVDEKGQFSDLLAGTLDGSGRTLEYDSTNLQAVVEHLFIREGINTIELEDLKKLYAGKREINSLADLADEDAIAITPDGMIVPMSRYAVGDIYPRIDALREAVANETDERLKAKFLKQIEAIMSRRKTTDPADIVFGMRQKWISRKYVVLFLREHGYPGLSYGTIEEVEEENPFDGTMQTKNKFVENFDTPFGNFTGIDAKGGFPKQFLNYLNGENVTSSGADAQDRIKEYKDRCATMEEQFNVWMQQHVDIDSLAEQYNRRFNGYTRFDYEDTDLGIKDVSPQIKLHGYQNSAVRRMSEEGGGILAHNVGLGKTFSALALYAYNKQLGRSKKTCIVVPKSVLANWYHESKTYLGNLNNVLMVGYEPKRGKEGNILQETVKDEKGQPKINKFTGKPMYQDMLIERNSKEDIWEAMWKIPQSNYSLVIMTKDKFGQIPLRPDTKKGYTDKMVSRALISEKAQKKALEEDLKNAGKSINKQTYQEDVTKTRLEQQFSDEGTAKKGELPYFEDMGFTDVIVDECFVYDTDIVTRSGLMKIGHICENMIQTDVLSRDLETGELVWKPIVRWLPKRLFVPLIKVTLENGSHFICTESHKIWTEEGGYVEAGNLRGCHSLQTLRESFSGKAVQAREREILQREMLCGGCAGKEGQAKGLSALFEGVQAQKPSGKILQSFVRGEAHAPAEEANRNNCSKAEERTGCEDLRMVRDGIQLQCERSEQEAVLQHEMLGALEEHPAGAEGKICGLDKPDVGVFKGPEVACVFSENEGKQSDDEPGQHSQDGRIIEGKNIPVERREFEADKTANNSCGCLESANGVSDNNEAGQGSIRVASAVLQGGLGDTGKEDCNRSGRQDAHLKEVEIFGQAENGGLECVRVVGIEVLEPGDYVRFGLGDPSGQTVYDLEVADTHNYFANGVLVSNCHEFKNSMLGGEHYQRVAYLPAPDTAQRAVDMSLKMNYLRDSNNGRGAYMLSATPVTNSPFEIFNMLSYVCPIEEFEKFGIYTPDDFIRVFGEIKQIEKMKVDGDIRSIDGLTGFQNLDGLRSVFHKYVNMKSAKDFPDQINLPPSEEINLDVELTEAQKEIYGELRERAKDAAKPGNAGSGESMFTIIREMDRVTTDLDLYNKTMTFVFRLSDRTVIDGMISGLPKTIKVRRMPSAEEAEAMGLEGDDKAKAKEFTIALKTASRVENDSYVVVFPEEYENTVVDHLRDTGINMSDVSHPLMPKYAKLIENLRTDLEADGKQLVFTEEKTQHKKLLRMIVHHIPTIANLIGVINADEAKGDELQKTSDLYNSGGLKFVICNKKAEVGVNLQKGTTAIHHLTLPWTPASIQQRNGRGVRQGNTAANIAIYYYCGRGSFDAYRLEILKAKSNWMQDLFEGGDATAENANAMNQDEMLDMLEADPEAAKARRLERLAAKKAEDEAKEKKRLANQLQVLAQATADLAKLDAEKEDTKKDLTEKIPELEAEIKRLKERGLAMEEDDPGRANLGTRIIQKQRTLANHKAKLENLEKAFGEKRTRLESVIKQTSGLLKQKAKKGALPFDERLIDNPGNACVTLAGKVIAAGDCYEAKGDGAFAGGYVLIKITEVNPAARAFKFEEIVGRLNIHAMKRADAAAGYGSWWEAGNIADLEEKGLKRVSYSEKEIDLKKMLAERHDYLALIDGKIDKDTFLDHRQEINFRDRSFYVIRDGAGKIAFKYQSYSTGMDELAAAIIYPDPANEEFKKGVCEAYLETRRQGKDDYGIRNVMTSLYGETYAAVALSYGKTAVESEILPLCAEAWTAELKMKGYENIEALVDFVAKNTFRNRALSVIQDVAYYATINAKNEATKLGDNKDDITTIVQNYFVSMAQTVVNAYEARKADLDREAEAKLKSDPRYKEVPKEVADAFLKLGITVKTNKTNMSIPGFKGRAGTGQEPFSKWFFQDRSGKYGALYKVKEIIKARFGARFFSNAGGEFNGAWWYVPISTDLKEIYELMA